MNKTGLIIELQNGRIKETNFGMITLARAKESELFALVMGDADAAALKDELEAFGITQIVDVSLPPGQLENPVVRAKAITNCIKKHDIKLLFGLSSARGKDLLPRIAALLEAPLVMDCFDVDLEHKLARTSCYSGKIIASIQVTGDVNVFGIRPNAVTPVKSPVSAKILKFNGTDVISKGFRLIKAGETDMKTEICLAEAELIIAGGRGMKNGANFSFLSRCANNLNGAVGASRVAVDAGWVPYSMQIGQTGEKVSPKVYIACGISGSVQHFAGMKTSGMIIAINSDKNASIMSNCDYYVQADALEILTQLIQALENG